MFCLLLYGLAANAWCVRRYLMIALSSPALNSLTRTSASLRASVSVRTPHADERALKSLALRPKDIHSQRAQQTDGRGGGKRTRQAQQRSAASWPREVRGGASQTAVARSDEWRRAISAERLDGRATRECCGRSCGKSGERPATGERARRGKSARQAEADKSRRGHLPACSRCSTAHAHETLAHHTRACALTGHATATEGECKRRTDWTRQKKGSHSNQPQTMPQISLLYFNNMSASSAVI